MDPSFKYLRQQLRGRNVSFPIQGGREEEDLLVGSGRTRPVI